MSNLSRKYAKFEPKIYQMSAKKKCTKFALKMDEILPKIDKSPKINKKSILVGGSRRKEAGLNLKQLTSKVRDWVGES